MNGGLPDLLLSSEDVRRVTPGGRTAPSVYFWRL